MTENPVDDALTEAAEYIQTEAKKSFNLSDRLKGIRTRRAKVLLFTDIEAFDAYSSVKAQLAKVQSRLGILAISTNPTEGGAAEKKDLDKRVKALAPKVEGLFQEALETSLGVHLRGVPNVVLKVARRDARKEYALNDGTIPADKVIDHNDLLNVLLLVSAIEKITTPDGGEKILLTREEVQELADDLPPTSWQALVDALDSLITKDTIADAATDEPGF